MNDLYILWTTADIITAENMVFMYAVKSLENKWWKSVYIIIWGAATKLVAENQHIIKLIKESQNAGINISACKACADNLNVTHRLKNLNIELKYWGMPLTEILKNNEKLLTI